MATVILVGIDGSTDSERTLTAAADLARHTHHDLVAMHVARVPTMAAVDPFAASAVISALDDTVEHCHLSCELALASRAVAWTFEVRHGDPAAELLQAGLDHAAVCIVVGRRGHYHLTRRLLGSVTSRLLLHADRPVLVVPLRPT